MVYVVLWANYGDQGLAFIGTFSTRENAEKFLLEREPDEHERQWYYIVESQLDDQSIKIKPDYALPLN